VLIKGLVLEVDPKTRKTILTLQLAKTNDYKWHLSPGYWLAYVEPPFLGRCFYAQGAMPSFIESENAQINCPIIPSHLANDRAWMLHQLTIDRQRALDLSALLQKNIAPINKILVKLDPQKAAARRRPAQREHAKERHAADPNQPNELL